MAEKCHNTINMHNNFDNPLTTRRTDGGKKDVPLLLYVSKGPFIQSLANFVTTKTS